MDFAQDQGIHELERISESVRNGDLTVVLQTYESDIKSPIRSIVRGTCFWLFS
jgi:ATP synthase regulation protein NCA2